MRALSALMLLLSLGGTTVFAQARPQLSETEAAGHQRADYFGDWQPQPLIDAARWSADFVVAADGSGSHRTLQEAVDAVPARNTGQRRYFLRIKPGIYRETVCVQDKAPITLYGDPSDAGAVTLVEGHYNGMPKRAGIDAANRCVPNLAAASYGTAGSATLTLFSDDVHLAYLTVANDAMDGVRAGAGHPASLSGEVGGAQAVALMTRGDRLQLHKLRLLGHQDTFYASSVDAAAPARVWVQASLIAGDVDFVFGNARLVIEDSDILSRAGRRSPGGEGGIVLAPSTAAGQPLGFLILHSRFLAEPGLPPASVAIGRAWDQGVAKGGWVAGKSPNGHALVRDSQLGEHIGPWTMSTSRRPYSSNGDQANRLYEYKNQSLP